MHVQSLVFTVYQFTSSLLLVQELAYAPEEKTRLSILSENCLSIWINVLIQPLLGHEQGIEGENLSTESHTLQLHHFEFRTLNEGVITILLNSLFKSTVLPGLFDENHIP